MLAQVKSLPALIRALFAGFDGAAHSGLDQDLSRQVVRLYLAGCGDSHHAGLTTEFAFQALAGLPVEALTAMQFARFRADILPQWAPGTCLVVGISASGEVARTVEALTRARELGASTLAVTATAGSRLARAAQHILLTAIPPFPEPPGTHTPGVRSYAASQLALFLLAVRLGELRGHLDRDEAAAARRELLALAEAAEATIAACEGPARNLVEEWADAQEFVILGSGPNYGTALSSAAKILEACGDSAIGQDTEEWAHLQYFARRSDTPTLIISAGGRDLSRAVEVALAARTLGRRLAVVAPPEAAGLATAATHLFPLPDNLRELFSPLIAAIPGELFAAYRAERLGETYFRGFGGGRSREEGGGISRIRSSEFPSSSLPMRLTRTSS